MGHILSIVREKYEAKNKVTPLNVATFVSFLVHHLKLETYRNHINSVP